MGGSHGGHAGVGGDAMDREVDDLLVELQVCGCARTHACVGGRVCVR